MQNQTSLYQLCHTLKCISLKVPTDFLPWNCATEALKTCTLLNFDSSRQSTERTCTHWNWMLIKSNSKFTADKWWFCLNRKSTTERTCTHWNWVLIKSNSKHTADKWWFRLNRKSTTERTCRHWNGVLIKSNSKRTADKWWFPLNRKST